MKSFTVVVIAALALSAMSQNPWALWGGAVVYNQSTGCNTGASTCATSAGMAVTTACTGAFYYGS